MDLSTILGLVVAIAAILGGQAIEGGHVGSLLQLTAFIIVMGGTIGAVSVSAPPKVLKRGLRMFPRAVKPPKDDSAELSAQIVELAALARREGVLALEAKLANVTEPLLKRGIGMVVDGIDRAVTREILEAQVSHHAKDETAAAKIWESAGGFAPTVGIIGAVLGLIHVMENLSDPSKLGGGIACAFVATVYGVAAANLLFLPVAAKLKMHVAKEKDRAIMIVEAVMAIQEGLSSSALAEKLTSYGGHPPVAAK
ncbi:MAG TPA: flagellar motor protein [Myxococcota bacterium]|jgi:chemotaxis protein MotA